jgi:hypothetical protein
MHSRLHNLLHHKLHAANGTEQKETTHGRV